MLSKSSAHPRQSCPGPVFGTAVGINARFTHSCLALFHIRETICTRLPGSRIAIRQFTINDPPYDIIQRLTDDAVDCLFFSALVWNSELVGDLIEDLLVMQDGPHIVVGGPQADIVGARFAEHDRVSVFCGAIEAAAQEFFDDLAGRSMKKRYSAHFFHRTDSPFLSPYRAEDFEGPLKNRSVYYESSRGCPFRCSYCLSSAETGLRHKDIGQVCQELTDILAHRPKTVRFVDRTFNDQPERTLAIWRFLAGCRTTTLFHFELAPDRFTEELFSFLETIEAGRFQFEIGLQSTHRPTLDAIRRPVDPNVAAAAIGRLRRLETIRIHVDLILGLPYETEPSFRQSLNDVFSMKPHYIQMGLLKILPDTEMAHSAGRFGYRFSRRPPYPVFANQWMPPETLKRLHRLGECVEHFVNNRYFPSLWSYLIDGGEDMAAFFSDLADLFVSRGFTFMAATQETLGTLLAEVLAGRSDARLCRELLIYDWLRCGHRLLPDHLGADRSAEESLRRELYRSLPDRLEGVYDAAGRNHFVRKHAFHRFSAAALRRVGYDGAVEGGVLCFTHEREATVFALHRTVRVVDETLAGSGQV